MNFYFDCDSEYPEIKVEKENYEYGLILLQDYSGKIGELTGITSYFYQSLILSDKYIDIRDILERILFTKIKHLKVLGKLIKLFGVNPEFRTIECYTDKNIYWDSKNINYDVELISILNNNIKYEINLINNYKAHFEFINDVNVKRVLERIIENEELNLKSFEDLFVKYSKDC